MISIDYLRHLKISFDFTRKRSDHDEDSGNRAAGKEAFHANWPSERTSGEHADRLRKDEQRAEVDYHWSWAVERACDACNASAAGADRAPQVGYKRTSVPAFQVALEKMIAELEKSEGIQVIKAEDLG